MKTLRKLDLDSMKMEFQVLNERENELIIGGQNLWEWLKAAVLDLIGYDSPAVSAAISGATEWSDYNAYTSGKISEDEFTTRTALNILSLAPLGNLAGTAISKGCDYVTTLAAQMQDYLNGLPSHCMIDGWGF